MLSKVHESKLNAVDAEKGTKHIIKVIQNDTHTFPTK